MSRIGNAPVTIPSNVEVKLDGSTLKVKGKQGELTLNIENGIEVKVEDTEINVSRANELKHTKSLHGMTRAMINNMVIGVSEGFEKKLEMVGVGYKAAIKGTKLDISAGFSHPVEIEIPKDLKIDCPKPTEIVISGIDKQRVGAMAAEIRKIRPPEPYKGKGIKYAGEVIIRKVGKTGA